MPSVMAQCLIQALGRLKQSDLEDSRLAWFAYWVLGQSGLHGETLSQTPPRNNPTKPKYIQYTNSLPIYTLTEVYISSFHEILKHLKWPQLHNKKRDGKTVVRDFIVWNYKINCALEQVFEAICSHPSFRLTFSDEVTTYIFLLYEVIMILSLKESSLSFISLLSLRINPW